MWWTIIRINLASKLGSNRRKVIVEGIGQLRRAVNRVTVAFDFFYATIISFPWRKLIYNLPGLARIAFVFRYYFDRLLNLLIALQRTYKSFFVFIFLTAFFARRITNDTVMPHGNKQRPIKNIANALEIMTMIARKMMIMMVMMILVNLNPCLWDNTCCVLLPLSGNSDI